MDELYRDHRIAVRRTGRWSARVTHVRGHLVPVNATATDTEGAASCLARARQQIDRYLDFLESPSPEPLEPPDGR